ncbi:KaiC domain-containing protein [Archaeoglobales archaeon]|nr:MAG: KaiC domain-containing protein [Archaeoglobales archaeon]
MMRAKLSTGIPGLDNLLGGGILEGHVVAVIGLYETGKTTLGLHFVYEGLKNGESCIIISFNEDEESIVENSKAIGMDLEQFKDKIQIVRLEAVEVKRNIEKIESELPEIINASNAKRMLIDTVSVLETIFEDAERYKVLAMLRRMLKSARITAIITSEADKYNPNSSKYGLLEYICDGLISLKVIRKSELDEPILGIEVVKMRRTKHSRKPKPYAITENGIVVFEEAEIF